jgi:hypothetical protein
VNGLFAIDLVTRRFLNHWKTADNNIVMAEPVVMTRLSHAHDPDREFDLEFWQRSGDAAIAAAAWEMVVLQAAQRGISEDQLRLQRSVTAIRRVRRSISNSRKLRGDEVHRTDLEQGD